MENLQNYVSSMIYQLNQLKISIDEIVALTEEKKHLSSDIKKINSELLHQFFEEADNTLEIFDVDYSALRTKLNLLKQ